MSGLRQCAASTSPFGTIPARLADVPRQGPLVVVANHPFGVVDGLALCHLVAKIRQDFRVVAMSTLCRMPEVRAHVLPINFANTRDAVATSARSRPTARALLVAGGCLLIFPAGAVSTSRQPFGPAEDAPWHPFVGRLVQSSRAAVLPVRFEGQNSRLFQLVSQISPTLRLSLLLREAVSRIGTEIEAHVGRVLPFESLAAFDDPKALVEHLREVTYGLEPGLPARPSHPGAGLDGRAIRSSSTAATAIRSAGEEVRCRWPRTGLTGEATAQASGPPCGAGPRPGWFGAASRHRPGGGGSRRHPAPGGGSW